MSAHIVEQVLSLSKADAAVVIVNEASSVNLRWANSTLTTNGSTRSHGITVVSIIDKCVGVRFGTSFDEHDLRSLVEASEADARAAEPAQDFAELVPGRTEDGFEDPAVHTTPSVFDTFARELGEAFKTIRIQLFGFAKHDSTTTWLGTSTGLRKRHVQPSGSVDWTAKNGKPRGSVWHGQATRDFTDVSVPETVVELQRRLGWAENVIDLEAGRYETILPPSAVADLLIYSYWSSAGRDAAEGRTAFSKPGGTRVGERLADAALQLYSDPHDADLATEPFVLAGGSSAASSVFDNGLPLSRTDWIKGGVLNSLIETRASARERGVPVTPAIDNLILSTSGTKTVDQMIKSTKRGLLVTCLWYIREVDPERLLLTGLTRDGVYLVEDGEVKGIVNNFRFNESPIELLGRIAEAGASVATLPREWGDYFTLTRMPPLRIPDFNMSTVSPAS